MAGNAHGGQAADAREELAALCERARVLRDYSEDLRKRSAALSRDTARARRTQARLATMRHA